MEEDGEQPFPTMMFVNEAFLHTQTPKSCEKETEIKLEQSEDCDSNLTDLIHKRHGYGGDTSLETFKGGCSPHVEIKPEHKVQSLSDSFGGEHVQFNESLKRKYRSEDSLDSEQIDEDEHTTTSVPSFHATNGESSPQLHVVSMLNSNMMDSDYLRNFSQLSYEDKLNVIRIGRPKPDLILQQKKEAKVARTFRSSWYDRREWLCGCVTKDKLFCFPCLLFSRHTDGAWAKYGFSDLNNLTNALNKHERSPRHYDCMIALKMFGTVGVDLSLDRQKQVSVENHNKKVKENRDTLKTLIDATCFLMKQELAFGGDNEGASSTNRGNYVELLHYTAKFNGKLKHQLETSSIFQGTSNRIQNDLLDSIATVLDNSIKEEIMKAKFVAIEVDEATDISNSLQCSTVLRYVIDAKITEVFVGFDELKDRTARDVVELVFKSLNKYCCVNKLVAQTYDAACVTTSDLNAVQAKVKEKAPVALFTHCYAHNLNCVLSQCAKKIMQCVVFFKTIEGLASFFNQSTERTLFLDKMVKERIPHAAPTKWNSNSNLVRTILFHHNDLCEMFHSINAEPEKWDASTVIKSSVFFKWLMDDSTIFLLLVFDKIFSVTSTLYNIMQTKSIDIHFCVQRISEAVNTLYKMKDQFETTNTLLEKYLVEKNVCESHQRGSLPAKEQRRILYNTILVNIIDHMNVRYRDFHSLKFIALLDYKNFTKFASVIDPIALASLQNHYGAHFDLLRLKTDLGAIYNAPLFREKSMPDLLSFMFENGLNSTFPEAVKLLQLILTIPATTVSMEKSFSALKRIESYTRNQNLMTSGQLSSLALVSIEKERLTQMERDPKEDFYTRVIDIFATTKDRGGLELTYK